MKMNLTGAIEILKQHKHTTDKFKHSVGDQYVSDAIDTVVKALEKPTYTAEDMEEFAEWMSFKEYSYHPKAKIWTYGMPNRKTTEQLRELWEQEMDVNTSEPPNIKQQCPECGDESYNSDGNYCLNSNCKLFII